MTKPKPRPRTAVQARLKLAHLLRQPNNSLAAKIRELEGSPLFAVLQQAGAVAIEPYSNARFAARRFGGWSLRAPTYGLAETLEGQDAALALAGKIGQDLFERCFLRDARMSDEERARLCRLSIQEVKVLRALLDRLEIQAELEQVSPTAPRATYSVVAGVEIQSGRPTLAFFHRDIWKGRYRISADKLSALRGQRDDFEQLQALAAELQHVARRQTTLFRVLETMLEVQADFLVTGRLERRVPLTQRQVAERIGSSPTVINALISNKALQLPSGIDVEMKVLVPSRKTVTKDWLYALALANPQLTDAELCEALLKKHGVRLARSSVAEYRKELQIGATKGRAKR